MDLLLVFLTVLAFAAAAVFGLAAWRARAEAEQRSAARVAALAAALGTEPGIGNQGSGIGDQGSGIGLPAPHPPIPDPRSMFATATTGSGLLKKPAIATAVAGVLLIGGGTLLRNDAQPEAAGRVETAALELVSMRHARDGRTLTVTGLVRNPPAGAPLSEVAALVFAFDRGGEFVASGRAALELPRLEPGEEAPFSVTMADLSDVGRYRVSFRTPAGPLRHIDRRAARQLVSTP